MRSSSSAVSCSLRERLAAELQSGGIASRPSAIRAKAVPRQVAATTRRMSASSPAGAATSGQAMRASETRRELTAQGSEVRALDRARGAAAGRPCNEEARAHGSSAARSFCSARLACSRRSRRRRRSRSPTGRRACCAPPCRRFPGAHTGWVGPGRRRTHEGRRGAPRGSGRRRRPAAARRRAASRRERWRSGQRSETQQKRRDRRSTRGRRRAADASGGTPVERVG